MSATIKNEVYQPKREEASLPPTPPSRALRRFLRQVFLAWRGRLVKNPELPRSREVEPWGPQPMPESLLQEVVTGVHGLGLERSRGDLLGFHLP